MSRWSIGHCVRFAKMAVGVLEKCTKRLAKLFPDSVACHLRCTSFYIMHHNKSAGFNTNKQKHTSLVLTTKKNNNKFNGNIFRTRKNDNEKITTTNNNQHMESTTHKIPGLCSEYASNNSKSKTVHEAQ